MQKYEIDVKLVPSISSELSSKKLKHLVTVREVVELLSRFKCLIAHA